MLSLVTEIVVVDSLASAVLNMGAFIFSLALATIPWIALVVVEPIDELSDTYYVYVSHASPLELLLAFLFRMPWTRRWLSSPHWLLCLLLRRSFDRSNVFFPCGA